MLKKHTICFKHAFDGLVLAFKTQPNYKIHFTLSIVALFLSWFLRISYFELLLVIFIIIIGILGLFLPIIPGIIFILAGIAGASFFLFGDNSLAFKSLITIGALIVYSLFGYLSARLLDNKDWTRNLTLVELITSTIALILVLPVIWELIEFDGTVGKIILSVSIMTFAIAHLAVISGKMYRWTKIAFFTNLVLIFAVVGLLISWVWVTGEGFEVPFRGFFNILGFFAVLDVIATIVTILLRKAKV